MQLPLALPQGPAPRGTARAGGPVPGPSLGSFSPWLCDGLVLVFLKSEMKVSQKCPFFLAKNQTA